MDGTQPLPVLYNRTADAFAVLNTAITALIVASSEAASVVWLANTVVPLLTLASCVVVATLLVEVWLPLRMLGRDGAVEIGETNVLFGAGELPVIAVLAVAEPVTATEMHIGDGQNPVAPLLMHQETKVASAHHGLNEQSVLRMQFDAEVVSDFDVIASFVVVTELVMSLTVETVRPGTLRAVELRAGVLVG